MLIQSEIHFPADSGRRALAGMVRTVSDVRLFDARWRQLQKAEIARLEEKARQVAEIEQAMKATL